MPSILYKEGLAGFLTTVSPLSLMGFKICFLAFMTYAPSSVSILALHLHRGFRVTQTPVTVPKCLHRLLYNPMCVDAVF